MGKNCVESRKRSCKIFDRRAEVAVELFYRSKSGTRFDAGIRRRHSETVPFFFFGILRGKKQGFPPPARRAAFGHVKNQEPEPFSVRAGRLGEMFYCY